MDNNTRKLLGLTDNHITFSQRLAFSKEISWFHCECYYWKIILSAKMLREMWHVKSRSNHL